MATTSTQRALSEVYVLVRDVASMTASHRQLVVNSQKGFFLNFEDAKSQAVGDEFPISVYRGYSLRLKRKKQKD